MRKELNNRLVGIFVLAAIVLGLLFVFVLGAGKYFRTQNKYILYFTESIEGLQEGAPVKFRGVRVGTVVSVQVEFNHANNKFYMPVVISIEPHRIEEINVSKNKKVNFMQVLMSKGLRGELQTAGLIVNTRYILLDTFAETPIRLIGLNKRYIEIPTIESKGNQFNDLAEIAGRTLKNINELAKSESLKQAIKDFGDFMIAGADFMITSKNTLKRAEQSLINFDDNINPLGDVVPNTMHDVMDTMSSIRVLADYLSRHPESLLRGKK